MRGGLDGGSAGEGDGRLDEVGGDGGVGLGGSGLQTDKVACNESGIKIDPLAGTQPAQATKGAWCSWRLVQHTLLMLLQQLAKRGLGNC